MFWYKYILFEHIEVYTQLYTHAFVLTQKYLLLHPITCLYMYPHTYTHVHIYVRIYNINYHKKIRIIMLRTVRNIHPCVYNQNE